MSENHPSKSVAVAPSDGAPEKKPKGGSPEMDGRPTFFHKPELLAAHTEYCRKALRVVAKMIESDKTVGLAVADFAVAHAEDCEVGKGKTLRVSRTISWLGGENRSFSRGRDFGFKQAFVIPRKEGDNPPVFFKGIPAPAPSGWIPVLPCSTANGWVLALPDKVFLEEGELVTAVIEANSSWGVIAGFFSLLLNSPEFFPLYAAGKLLGYSESDVRIPPKSSYAHLSVQQSDCVNMFLRNTATFIWGPPGTGKSTVLSAVVVEAYKHNCRTLCSAPSNDAVDSLAESLLKRDYQQVKDAVSNGNFFRYGSSDRLPFAFKNFRKRTSIPNPKDKPTPPTGPKSMEFATIYRIFAKMPDQFPDVIVFDEAGMISPPLLYAAACIAKEKIVVCGDPMQGEPVFEGQPRFVGKENTKIWQTNIFETLGFRLRAGELPDARVCRLTVQHRMRDGLAAAVRTVGLYPEYITFPHRKPSPQETNALNSSPSPQTDLVWVDTSQTPNNSSSEHVNRCHAAICIQMALDIFGKGEAGRVGIIAPYKNQARHYATWIHDNDLDKKILAGTVHAFQGSECPAIIFDTTEAPSSDKPTHFWTDDEKNPSAAKIINVAVSRGMGKLIIVGHADYIRKNLSSSCSLQRILALTSKNNSVVPASKPKQKKGVPVAQLSSFPAADFYKNLLTDATKTIGDLSILSSSIDPAHATPLIARLSQILFPLGASIKIFAPKNLPCVPQAWLSASSRSGLITSLPDSTWSHNKNCYLAFDKSFGYFSDSKTFTASPLAGIVPPTSSVKTL